MYVLLSLHWTMQFFIFELFAGARRAEKICQKSHLSPSFPTYVTTYDIVVVRTAAVLFTW